MASKRNPRRANGSRRSKLRGAIKAEGKPCGICGEPIDYELPPGHPLSFEVDEIIPVSRFWEGGYKSPEECALDRGNLRAVHRICNQRRGNKTERSKFPKAPTELTLPKSRIW